MTLLLQQELSDGMSVLGMKQLSAPRTPGRGSNHPAPQAHDLYRTPMKETNINHTGHLAPHANDLYGTPTKEKTIKLTVRSPRSSGRIYLDLR